MSQASSYIGRHARFDTPVAGLGDGRPADWSFQYTQQPSSLIAHIKDDKGAVVRTMAVTPALQGKVVWDGASDVGGKMPAGNYTLALEAKDINGATINGAITASGTITSAMMLDGRAIVSVDGTNYPLDALLSIDSAEAVSAK
ncbi:flagellar hook assembly protein FlgD [Sphingomonas sp. DT-51]|uniref:flagellar hook assembly protein FlgD n=1 Tax=Sphingomonas sp. DT-51 TaxID=3396165 RepID=UPI003F1AF752